MNWTSLAGIWRLYAPRNTNIQIRKAWPVRSPNSCRCDTSSILSKTSNLKSFVIIYLFFWPPYFILSIFFLFYKNGCDLFLIENGGLYQAMSHLISLIYSQVISYCDVSLQVGCKRYLFYFMLFFFRFVRVVYLGWSQDRSFDGRRKCTGVETMWTW